MTSLAHFDLVFLFAKFGSNFFKEMQNIFGNSAVLLIYFGLCVFNESFYVALLSQCEHKIKKQCVILSFFLVLCLQN